MTPASPDWTLEPATDLTWIATLDDRFGRWTPILELRLTADPILPVHPRLVPDGLIDVPLGVSSAS